MPLALMPAGRATGPRSAVERSRSAARSWGWKLVRPRSRPQRATGQGLPAGLHATPLFTWTFSVGEGGLEPPASCSQSRQRASAQNVNIHVTWTFGAGPSRSVTPCANSLWHVFGTGLSRRPSEQGPRGTSAFGTSVESHHVDAPIHTRSYSRFVRNLGNLICAASAAALPGPCPQRPYTASAWAIPGTSPHSGGSVSSMDGRSVVSTDEIIL